MAHHRDIDLITLGRSCVDLYGQQFGGRLEDMGSFSKYIGGSPTNTAIGGARLGLRTGLITRVGNDHMGRFVREQLVREGVDTTGVITDLERLTALVILGIVDKETFPLIFYRENCADMAINIADIDTSWIASSSALLINGTHLSTPSVYDASLAAANLIKAAGGKLIFDIDYRPVLWGLTTKDMGEQRYVPNADVTQKLSRVLALCDLVIGTEEEIKILGGYELVIESLIAIRERTSAIIVYKLGADGCAIFEGPIPERIEDALIVPGFKIEIMNVLGAGDAFSAGFLRGYLRGESLAVCGQWGNACGAMVVMRHGCAPEMPSFHEMQNFIKASHPLSQQEMGLILHQHWAEHRRGHYPNLMVLAIDHRLQFEDLVKQFGCDPSRISQFKNLALKAMNSAAAGCADYGILLDGTWGTEALSAASTMPYWIGRPIEVPKSRPLRFEGERNVALELNRWPVNQVVKCLVLYHPDDEEALRAEQEASLLMLYEACRGTGHELLLELILPQDMPSDHTTRARGMQRLYDIGIKPDWWKLEPIADARVWTGIDAVITKNDPLCRGVVLLGLSATVEEMINSFDVIATTGTIKGFAVGRTIFYDAAKEWFAGRCDDEKAISLMSDIFTRLVAAWRESKGLKEAAA